MKRILLILFYIVLTKSLFAINKYSIGDNLYLIDENVNLRSEPNLTSKVINKLSKGSVVKSLETKFDKSSDICLSEKTSWKFVLTGKWTKIEITGEVGYIFDAYLSYYNFKEIVNSKLVVNHDTILVQNYETYTRTIYANGVINEIGIGMEWGQEIFIIPDLTFEEAILFIKPKIIDFSYGKKVWEIKEDEIKLKESDGISSRELEIKKRGQYVIIEIRDGV